MGDVVGAAKGQGLGKSRPTSKASGAIQIIVTEDDADPEKSREIYNVPGWSHVKARDRAALILNQLGWRQKQIAEALECAERTVGNAINRADPDRKLRRTPRDVMVAKVMMCTQLETAAMEHITPQKLKATGAKDLAVIAAMMSDKGQKFIEMIVDWDREHPVLPEGEEGGGDIMARAKKIVEVESEKANE